MSYLLNRTDGTLLTELIDGQIDNSSTNLTFVGKNYTGYGEAFNENFIRLLENFSNTAAPSNPLSGQLWWDTVEQRLKVYNGTEWKSSGGPIVQNSIPQMVAGDLWINNLTNQVYAFNGTDRFLIGPVYTEQQGKSGFEIGSILDSTSRSRTVTYLYNSGQLVAVISDIEFTPQYSQRITSLVTTDNPNGTIFKGINVLDKDNFSFYGTAESANALVTSSGEIRTAGQFLPSDANGVTIGTLTIQNSGGITVGLSNNHVQKVVGQAYFMENQLRDHDLSLRITSTLTGSTKTDAIFVDASTARVGIFNNQPQAMLHIGSPTNAFGLTQDVIIEGNLLVKGDTTTVEVSTIRIEDKNIELGALDDSSIGGDLDIDNGGVIIKSGDGDKELTWLNATQSWSSNQSFDLTDETHHYSIAGSPKLTNDSLSNILYADSLIRIGTLVNLDVDDININSNTISNDSGSIILSATTGFTFTAGGDIAISDNQKITGLADPTSAQDAATKAYVDSEILTTPIIFSLDVTGLSNPDPAGTNNGPITDVANILNTLNPATAGNSGKTAKIHCTNYSGAAVTGIVVDIRENVDPDTGEVLTVSRVAVDKNGTENQSVIQDVVASNTASGVASLTPGRYTMTFESNGSSWVHQSTTSYP